MKKLLFIFMILVIVSCQKNTIIKGNVKGFNVPSPEKFEIYYTLYNSLGESLEEGTLNINQKGNFRIYIENENIKESLHFDLMNTDPIYTIEGDNDKRIDNTEPAQLFIAPRLNFQLIDFYKTEWVLVFDTNINLQQFDLIDICFHTPTVGVTETYRIEKDKIDRTIINITSFIEENLFKYQDGLWSIEAIAYNTQNGKLVKMSSSYKYNFELF